MPPQSSIQNVLKTYSMTNLRSVHWWTGTGMSTWDQLSGAHLFLCFDRFNQFNWPWGIWMRSREKLRNREGGFDWCLFFVGSWDSSPLWVWRILAMLAHVFDMNMWSYAFNMLFPTCSPQSHPRVHLSTSRPRSTTTSTSTNAVVVRLWFEPLVGMHVHVMNICLVYLLPLPYLWGLGQGSGYQDEGHVQYLASAGCQNGAFQAMSQVNITWNLNMITWYMRTPGRSQMVGVLKRIYLHFRHMALTSASCIIHMEICSCCVWKPLQQWGAWSEACWIWGAKKYSCIHVSCGISIH